MELLNWQYSDKHVIHNRLGNQDQMLVTAEMCKRNEHVVLTSSST